MEYSPHKANRIFVTLQTVLEERLPLQISCDPLLLAEAVGSLDA